MDKIFDKTFLKFAVIGAINTIIGSAVMFITYNLCKWNYWESSAANYIVGSVLSYFLNKYFTFRYEKKSFVVVIKFILNIIGCYILAYGVAKPLATLILANANPVVCENMAMFIGMGMFMVFNFFGQKFSVFRL